MESRSDNFWRERTLVALQQHCLRYINWTQCSFSGYCGGGGRLDFLYHSSNSYIVEVLHVYVHYLMRQTSEIDLLP